jgi:hypothetical protein
MHDAWLLHMPMQATRSSRLQKPLMRHVRQRRVTRRVRARRLTGCAALASAATQKSAQEPCAEVHEGALVACRRLRLQRSRAACLGIAGRENEP